MRHAGVLAAFAALLALAPGCSSGSQPATDASAANDACVPISDSPMRGTACTTGASCPTGYDCRASFSASTTCEISCTPAAAACVCPTGLRCEVPPGSATGICS